PPPPPPVTSGQGAVLAQASQRPAHGNASAEQTSEQQQEEEDRRRLLARSASPTNSARERIGMDAPFGVEDEFTHDRYCEAATAGDANRITQARDGRQIQDPTAPRPALHAPESSAPQCPVAP
ncbi:MAG: hypothetical protein KGS44_15065, partial [Alphaproteobacteria bacterium]|nr:hypothetical protein [Alphaproteobacteria bacterium]